MNYQEESKNKKRTMTIYAPNRSNCESSEENTPKSKKFQNPRGRKPKDCYVLDEEGNKVLIPEFKAIADSINSDASKVNFDVIKEEIIENEYFMRWFAEIFPKKRPNNNAMIPYVFKERGNADFKSKENEIEEAFKERVLFVSKKKKEISMKRINWDEKTKIDFKRNFEIYGKNFLLISKLLNKPIKECILFYYRTKRIFKYVKRVFKYTDEQLKLIVESEWSQNDMDLFEQCYNHYNGNINKFSNMFLNKDVRLYLKYFNKFIIKLNEEKELRKAKEEKENEEHKIKEIPIEVTVKKTVKKPPEEHLEILRHWSADERQLFSIYYPYFQKNWILYSEHIKSKKMSDFSKYFRHYFKKLTYNERLFENNVKQLYYDPHRKLFTFKNDKIIDPSALYISSGGILFKPK